MSTELAVRAISLYWPMLALLVLWVWLQPDYFARVGLLLALLWNLVTLPLLSWVAVKFGWWSFHTTGPTALGMPLELYFGWVALWGGVLPLAGLVLFRNSLAAYLVTVVVVALGVDVLAMPRMGPVLFLAPDWWWGELLLLVLVLGPGLLVAWWTAHRSCLGGRVLVQAGLFSLGLFMLVPSLARGDWSWLDAGDRPAWLGVGFGLLMILFAALGLMAVGEFWRRGGGTPVPFDPPVRLVTTGPYRWVANPMQLAMTGLLLLWGLWFAQWWLLVLAGLGVVYSEGLARWSEDVDHRERFGDEWVRYRRRVRRWWPRGDRVRSETRTD